MFSVRLSVICMSYEVCYPCCASGLGSFDTTLLYNYGAYLY